MPSAAHETGLHFAVADLLARTLLPPCEWTTFPAFGYTKLTEKQTGELDRRGVHGGWPDILILSGPGLDGGSGRLLGLELKTERGRLSRTRLEPRGKSGRLREVIGQAEMFPRLLRAGFADIAICRSLNEVSRQIRAWNLPMREHAVGGEVRSGNGSCSANGWL